MHRKDHPSPAENQELLQRERELQLEVAEARLQATLAEYKLALLELIVANPTLAGVLSEVFARDTGEELFSKPIQQEPTHAG
jgi:hypothetical protein